MAAWTVMTPPGKAALEGAVFIPHGFNWFAAIFGPFWALANRMWIVAILLGVATILAGLLPPPIAIVTEIGLWLTTGIFAADLRQWTFARRGFAEAAQLIAASREEAEVRFFSARVEEEPEAHTPPPAPPRQPSATGGVDPLGLFGSG